MEPEVQSVQQVRPRGPFSEKERNAILVMIGERKNPYEIAAALNRPRTSVVHIVNKYLATGLTSRKKGLGSKPKYDNVFCSEVIQFFVDNPMKTYPEGIAEKKWSCSTSFISSLLIKHNIRASIAPKKPFLNDNHLRQRANFSNITADWTIENWKKVIFSDEKTVQSFPNGRVKVKRVRGSPYNPEHTVSVSRNKFKINIWGCIIGSDFSFHIFHVDDHFTAALYRYHLHRVWFPLFSEKYQNSEFIFQQDNAPIHTARIIKKYFEDTETVPLFWPACSPDLSPIETMWAILQNRISKRLRNTPALNKWELFQIAQEESQLIEKKTVEKLYIGMPKRIQMLQEHQHKAIKY